MRQSLLNALLYHPARAILETPAAAGLAFEDLAFEATDGVRLHGWWIPAPGGPSRGHILFCHGNGGNVGDRVRQSALLCRAGFDVLTFDYRGYGRSQGTPDEDGTYRDARAARGVLLEQRDVAPSRVLYLGESLGGAVALALALEHPPAGLVLQSTFAGIREIAQVHYPFIPTAVVPDAYPSLRRMARLRAPLLVLHGDRDRVVPLSHGEALFAAAPDPKHMRVFAGAAHNDLLAARGDAYVETIAAWADGLGR